MFEKLRERGFQVETLSHAQAILKGDFPAAAKELEEVLLNAQVPIEEIIAGGGGEAKGTQRLRKGLQSRGWATKTFTVVKTINGLEREAISHKMDHVKGFPDPESGEEHALALEIEWNNKDPFFDRDLENFKRLHADGAISAGMIITRGRALHDGMRAMVGRFVEERKIKSLDDLLEWGYDPTARQRNAITKRVTRARSPISFRESFVAQFVSDKFGEATTHWKKLEDRVSRGVGNPCPLVLIGLPDSIVTFGEDESTVREIIAAAQSEENDAQTSAK
ncbi:BglII/BstYI family type II restriction endonuclease [Methyloceanibacter sp.]|uniref:BglII/BstYI family type II restriction endonuclease n=1 Tax=Methyloceanibacter sp. TaxID=1965321 RepID=UPI003D6D2891